MDSIAALKTSIYELLTQDAELTALWDGTPVVSNVWPDPDQSMPYICYRASSIPSATLDPVAVATLTLDLWDENATGNRMSDIRERVCLLLEGALIKTDSGTFRVRKTLDQELEEDERYVWHTTSDWSVRYTREREVTKLGE